MNPEFESKNVYNTFYDDTLDQLIQQYTMASLNNRFEERDPVEVLTEKCKKLEKTIKIIIELLPEDIKSSVKVALELDEGEDEED